ncbi:MAG: phosphoribosyltransferase family protein [Rubrivivax sp.]
MPTLFVDRAQAGAALAEALHRRRYPAPIVVLALPRGGVPLGATVAERLGAPLDLLLVRKIGAPGQPEFAVAAVVDGTPPVTVVDPRHCALTSVGRAYIDSQTALAQRENQRRRRDYLHDRVSPALDGATVIVVDDGLATGTTARAALRALRARHPARLVLAVPVGPADTVTALRAEVDELVCLAQPSPFIAVGRHYAEFPQVDDAEVRAALDAAAARVALPPPVTR